MWTDTSPAINPHVVEPPLGTSPWPESLARWNTKIFTTGNPNHNVSLSFQFSCLGQTAPVVRFQLFRKLFKENRTKNHNAFKNTQRAGGEALFSIFELTQEGWQRQHVARDARAGLLLPCGTRPAVTGPNCSRFTAGSVSPSSPSFHSLSLPCGSVERNLRSSRKHKFRAIQARLSQCSREALR